MTLNSDPPATPSGLLGLYVCATTLSFRGAGDQVQGSIHARQVFCQLSYTPSPYPISSHSEHLSLAAQVYNRSYWYPVLLMQPSPSLALLVTNINLFVLFLKLCCILCTLSILSAFYVNTDCLEFRGQTFHSSLLATVHYWNLGIFVGFVCLPWPRVLTTVPFPPSFILRGVKATAFVFSHTAWTDPGLGTCLAKLSCLNNSSLVT